MAESDASCLPRDQTRSDDFRSGLTAATRRSRPAPSDIERLTRSDIERPTYRKER